MAVFDNGRTLMSEQSNSRVLSLRPAHGVGPALTLLFMRKHVRSARASPLDPAIGEAGLQRGDPGIGDSVAGENEIAQLL